MPKHYHIESIKCQCRKVIENVSQNDDEVLAAFAAHVASNHMYGVRRVVIDEDKDMRN